MKHIEYIVPIGAKAEDYDEMFIGVIRRQPELIRCKDCKHYNPLDFRKPFCCDYGIVDAMLDDFCSRAERKEDKE